MILLAVLVVALILVPLAGGRLSRLADIEIKAVWAVAAALGLQVLIISVIPDRFEGIHAPIHFASYGFAAVFVWANRRLPGMLVIALGALLNLAAITANGGVMPATPAALRSAGLDTDPNGFANSTAVDDPKLQFLGDIWAIPDSVPLLDNVFSVGDVLIAVGLSLLIHGVCGSKLMPRALRAENPGDSEGG